MRTSSNTDGEVSACRFADHARWTTGLFRFCALWVPFYFFSVSPALKSILSFFHFPFCLISSLIPFPCSFLSQSPSLLWKGITSSQGCPGFCSYAITMGTVTEEIMSESERETDWWSGGGGGGTPASCGLLWFGRTTMWEKKKTKKADKQGQWIDRQIKSKRRMKGDEERKNKRKKGRLFIKR